MGVAGSAGKHGGLFLHLGGVDGRVELLKEAELVEDLLAASHGLAFFFLLVLVDHGLSGEFGLGLGSEDDRRDDLFLLWLSHYNCYLGLCSMVDFILPRLLRIEVAFGLSVAIGAVREGIIGIVAFDCPGFWHF